MVAKAVILFSVQALLAQCISCQCIGAAYNGLALDTIAPWGAPYAGLPYAAEVPFAAAPCAGIPFATAEWVTGYGPAGLAASNGGGFPITSASPIAATGVFMTSQNLYEGPLAVSGAVPFLGSVSLEGALPTIGAGAVAYGCGNGNVAIISEDIGYNGYAGAYGYGPGIAADLGYGYGTPLAYDAGFAGPVYGYNEGCGYGPFY